MSEDTADMLSRVKKAQAGRTKKKEKTTTQDTVKKAVVICAVAVGTGTALLYVSPPKSFYDLDINNLSLIEQVNQNAKIWTAAKQPAFEGWTVGDMRDMGAVSWRHPEANWHLCPGTGDPSYPESFDVREKWPDCFPDIVHNQGNCSASYAIAAVTSLANRYCINDPVNYKMLGLSYQNLISCDMMSDGCSGGGMDTVWTFLEQEGVVSETCMPFQGWGVDCEAKCAEETPLKLAGKCIAQGIDSIKKEVWNHGPVVAPIKITDELLVYKGGIFLPTKTAVTLSEQKRKQQKKMAVVKITGWGVEDDQPFWIVENTWGKDWGENGFARIAIVESEDPMEHTVSVDFTFSGYPNNLRDMSKQAGMEDEFDDIHLEGDDALDDLNFDDDIALEDDDIDISEE